MSLSVEQIPQMLKFSAGLKPQSVPSKVIKRSYLPEGGSTFNESNRNIRIRINGGNTAFLDTSRTYLQFTLDATVPAGKEAYIHSGYSLIDRLEVLNGAGAPIETISEYGRLANALSDCFQETQQRSASGSLAGFPIANGYSTALVAVDGATVNTPMALHYQKNNMTEFPAGASPTTVSRTFTLPIVLSGLFTMSSNAGDSGLLLPLPLLSNGLMLSIYLRDAISKCFFGADFSALPGLRGQAQ